MSEMLNHFPSGDGKPTGGREAEVKLAEIQEKLRIIIEEYHIKHGELRRGACRLANEYGLDPGLFADLLIIVGLPKSRASEMATVLRAREVCDAFLGEKITWREALRRARSLKPKAAERKAARLVHMWNRQGEHWPDGAEEGGWRLLRGQGVARFVNRDGPILDILLLTRSAAASDEKA